MTSRLILTFPKLCLSELTAAKGSETLYDEMVSCSGRNFAILWVYSFVKAHSRLARIEVRILYAGCLTGDAMTNNCTIINKVISSKLKKNLSRNPE